MTDLYISDQAALIDFCQEIQTAPWLAVDTEFIRERTFYPQLCLIQIGLPHQTACIDPLALPSLQPLLDVLLNPTILKILHAAHQDLEILFYLCNAVLSPVFDTQLAALVLGSGSQIGYAALVQEQFGVVLPKSHTRADWRQRPLAPAWLAYAADDVRYLGQIYQKQHQLLEQRGWLAALNEDFQALTDPERYRLQPEQAWQRLRGQNRLRRVHWSVLRALAAWRERQAMMCDRPRRWIIEDAVMLELAQRLPKTEAQLQQMRSLSTATRERHGLALLAQIITACGEPSEQWPAWPRRPRLTPAQAVQVERLLEHATAQASHYQIPLPELAERRDIERLIVGEDCRLLHGWRAKVIGLELAALAAPAHQSNTMI